jgi:iron complex outermembrane receptor protein
MQAGVLQRPHQPFGAQTAAGQAAIDAAQVSEPTLIGKAHVDFIDFKVSKELWQMGGGATGFAFGAEARKEKSNFEATDITATLGSLGIDPDSDTSGSRKVYAAFVELNLPVLKNLEINVPAATTSTATSATPSTRRSASATSRRRSWCSEARPTPASARRRCMKSTSRRR